jgi:hypothetical protein
MTKESLTRDQALNQASELADATLKKTWVVRTIAGEKHSYENVLGYEVRAEQPRDDEDVYRMVMPAPIHSNVDDVTLIIVKQCGYVHVKAYFETLELAQEYAARFPKSLKMKPANVSGYRDAGCNNYSHWAFVFADIKLSSDDVNKGVNESGLARLRRIQKLAPSIIFDESA